jgi:hypothetical protein
MPERPLAAIERGLAAVGELLESEGVEVGIAVVGGTAMNLLGIIRRTTSDVDVLAVVQGGAGRELGRLMPPDPLPEPLRRAIARVAKDFQLPSDWMNAVVGLQW